MSDVYTDSYWTDEFDITEADLERISRRMRENRSACDLTELAKRVVRGRLRHGPEASPATSSPWAGVRSVRLWDPSAKWRIGDHVIVPVGFPRGPHIMIHEIEVFAYCLMPDHLHFLVRPCEDGISVLTFTDQYKGKATNESWQFGWRGKLWQPRYYDHIVRDDESLVRIAQYILDNPVRQGLVERAEEWPWSGHMNPLPVWPVDGHKALWYGKL